MGFDGIGFHAVGEMITGPSASPYFVYNPVSKISAQSVAVSPPLVDLRLAILWDDGDFVLWDDGTAILWD